MKRHAGFTLHEMMMTVIIVGILAALALPSYRKTIELGYKREAQDVLMTIYNGERSYFFTKNTYRDNPTTMDQWREIYVENPNLGSIPVTFAVTATPTTFTATATRQDGSGRSMTVNQDRLWCSTLLTDPALCPDWLVP